MWPTLCIVVIVVVFSCRKIINVVALDHVYIYVYAIWVICLNNHKITKSISWVSCSDIRLRWCARLYDSEIQACDDFIWNKSIDHERHVCICDTWICRSSRNSNLIYIYWTISQPYIIVKFVHEIQIQHYPRHYHSIFVLFLFLFKMCNSNWVAAFICCPHRISASNKLYCLCFAILWLTLSLVECYFVVFRLQ